MARVLEARAIITATAQGFAAVEAKLAALARTARGVNGVSGRMAVLADGADAAGKKMMAVGRKMTYGITLPAIAAGTGIYHTARELALAGNKLKAFGDLTEEQFKHLSNVAQKYGSNYAFGPVGVMQGMVEQIKAGFEARHLEAIQQPILDFATIAGVTVPEAAELAIFALSGFGKMFDKAGRMLDASPLKKNLTELIDLYAILNKVAPGSIKQISETFKYAAPAASQLGVSPEQLGAFTAVLNQAGILGPEAGVALRSMMVRFIKPTRPALAALNAIGMKLDDYVKINPDMLKPEAILSAVENYTGKAAGKKGKTFTVGKADARHRDLFLRRVAALQGLEGEDYVKGLTNVIRKTVGGGLQDAKIAGDLAQRIVGTAIENIDVMKFLADASAKAPNFAAFMAQFMDQRQAVRLANLHRERIITLLGDIQRELAAAREKNTSVARDQAGKINAGMIEAENRLRGAYQGLVKAIFESGAADGVTNFMTHLASGLKWVSEVNPKILELATYGTAAAAALGPLAYILGTLAKTGGAVLKAISWALPAGTTAALAAAARTPAGAVFLAGIPAMLAYEDTKAAANPEAWARYREMLMRGGFIARDRDFAPDKMSPLTLDGVRAALEHYQPNARVDGRIEIQVLPSADFWVRVKKFFNFGSGSKPPGGSTGPTGTSMPEAGSY